MKRKISLGTGIIILVAAVLVSIFGTLMACRTWRKNVNVSQDESIITTERAKETKDPAGKDTDEVTGNSDTGTADTKSADTDGEPAKKTGEIDEQAIMDEMTEIKRLIDENYIGDVYPDDVKKNALTGFVFGLGDKYGGYYDPESYKQLKADMSGDMQGIGVSVIYNADFGGIEVIDVFPDSPAMEAGMMAGDLIMYCGDDLESVSFLGYEAALAKLRGEAGTKAVFVAYRGENYEEEIRFEIVRDYITEQSVTYRLYDADKSIGIVKISSFNTATVAQFNKAIDELIGEGVEKIIFDVRNNPGGGLNSICSILDRLLPEGPVIRTKTKNSDIETVYASDEEELDVPMAVIVNAQTASAAELFTSALRDYDKAVIVGETTYGKGSMQTMYPLSDGGCVKMTSALYYPPFSDNYDGVGITPDIEASLSEEASKKSIYRLTDEEDDQLLAAVKALDGADK